MGIEINPLLSKENNVKTEKNQKSEDNSNNQKLLKASKDFEGIFLSYLIKSMENTIPENPITGTKNNLAKMMFSTVMGEHMVKNGGIGLTEFIFKYLKEDNLKTIKEFNFKDYTEYINISKLKRIDDE